MVRMIMFCTALVLGYLWVADAFTAPQSTINPTSVPVSELLQNPETYENAFVTVSGTVAQRASVLGYGGFYLRDSAGKDLLVVSKTTPLAPDSPVTVQGRYLSAFTLGDQSLPVLFAQP